MVSNRANKRTRINPKPTFIEDENSQTQPRSTAPLVAAKTHITSYMQSLQPGLAAILEYHGKAHLNRLHRLYNKCLQINKMEQDDEFFPCLVRFEFKLHCSKSTEQPEGYTALQEKVNTSLADMKRIVKTHVIEATKLNQDTENRYVLEEYAKSIQHIVKAYQIGNPTVARTNKIVALMLNDHGDDLLKHIGTVDNFKKAYLEIHNVSAWPATTMHRFAHSSQDSNNANDEQESEAKTICLTSSICHIIE